MMKYRICTNCVMDTTDSGITFDDAGFCDHCQNFYANTLPNWHTNQQGRETLERTVQAYADDKADGKLGKVAQPLRIAVSGGTVSPAIFDTLVILGKESVINRIERCLEHREMFAAS